MKKLKLNQKELLDGVIAAVTVENAPLILSKAGLPTAGVTGQLMAGVLAYVVGMVLKKPTIANVGIAVAVGNLVNEALTPVISGAVNGTSTASLPNTNLQTLGRLREYTSSPRGSLNYARFYN
jgi:hypothetical protein